MTTRHSYAEDTGRGGYSRNYSRGRGNLPTFLTRAVPVKLEPLAWNDVALWRGKTVTYCKNGQRRQVVVVTASCAGQWFVDDATRAWGKRMVSVRVSDLELRNPYALAIVPQTSRAIVVYTGNQKPTLHSGLMTKQV